MLFFRTIRLFVQRYQDTVGRIPGNKFGTLAYRRVRLEKVFQFPSNPLFATVRPVELSNSESFLIFCLVLQNVLISSPKCTRWYGEARSSAVGWPL